MGNSLHLVNTGLAQGSYTVVIYWHPRNAPDALANGHAALIIDTKLFNGSEDYYVSWAGAGDGKTIFRHSGSANTFMEDTANWGGNPINATQNLPSRWVALQGLHMANMKDEWDRIRQKQQGHWKLFDKNCATVVARVLKAGAGDRFATAAQEQLVWWPSDLIRYARSMGTAIHMTS
jgi:hypothetical protein